MKRFILLVAAVALIVAYLIFSAGRRADPQLSHANLVATPTTAAQPETSNPETPPTGDEQSHLADNLNATAGDIRADLRIVLDLVDTFRSNFPRDGNPVGNNAEITAALTGRNQLRLVLIPRRHPAINAQGELCDRWGTPFFFHAESGTKMEIRSAGPDKKFYSTDDVSTSP